jgi:hypothetical protein
MATKQSHPSEIGESDVPKPPSEPPFYSVGTRKLAFMYAATLGFYGFHWMYENWWNIKERRGDKFSPKTRTFLAPVFLYPLFREIRRAADEERIPTAFSPLGATLLYVVGTLVSLLLVGDLWPVTFLCFYLTFHSAQHLANQVNAIRAPEADRNERLTIGNKIIVLVGGGVFILTLLGAGLRLQERLTHTPYHAIDDSRVR